MFCNQSSRLCYSLTRRKIEFIARNKFISIKINQKKIYSLLFDTRLRAIFLQQIHRTMSQVQCYSAIDYNFITGKFITITKIMKSFVFIKVFCIFHFSLMYIHKGQLHLSYHISLSKCILTLIIVIDIAKIILFYYLYVSYIHYRILSILQS